MIELYYRANQSKKADKKQKKSARGIWKFKIQLINAENNVFPPLLSQRIASVHCTLKSLKKGLLRQWLLFLIVRKLSGQIHVRWWSKSQIFLFFLFLLLFHNIACPQWSFWFSSAIAIEPNQIPIIYDVCSIDFFSHRIFNAPIELLVYKLILNYIWSMQCVTWEPDGEKKTHVCIYYYYSAGSYQIASSRLPNIHFPEVNMGLPNPP